MHESEFAKLVCLGPGSLAAENKRGYIIGSSNGEIRVVEDNAVLRVFRVAAPLTKLVVIDNLLIVIANYKCEVHDLETRKLKYKMVSSSAHDLAIWDQILFVASKYKLRTLDLRSGEIAEVKLPKSTRVRCLSVYNKSIYAVLNSSLVSVTENLRTLLNCGKKDVLVFVDGYLWIGGGGGQEEQFVISNNDGLKVRNALKCDSVAWIRDSLCKIGLFSVIKDGKIEFVDPRTGTVLNGKDMSWSVPSDSKLVRGGPFLSFNNEIYKLEVKITKDYILNCSPDLALQVPGNSILGHDFDILNLQISSASKLMKTDLDEAMKVFTKVEIQDKDNKCHVEILELLQKYLTSVNQEEEFKSDASFSVTSAKNSTFSNWIGVKRHKLDSVVGYLTLARRKLRLMHFKGPSLTTLDTLLFNCYIWMRSPLVTSLLRSSNSCDLEVVKPVLLKLGKWRELVVLLRSRGEYRNALQIMVEHNESPEAIVTFLEQTKPSWDVIIEYAGPALLQKPELANSLFFENEFEDNIKVYEFLNSVLGSEWAGKYALHLVDNKRNSVDIINEYALIYLASVDLDKCLDFAKHNKHIRPLELVRLDLPQVVLAVLHSRAGNKKLAMDIFFDLDDWKSALELVDNNNLSEHFLVTISKSENMMTEFLCRGEPKPGMSLPQVLNYIEPQERIEMSAGILANFFERDFSNTDSSGIELGLMKSALTELSVQLVDLERRKYEVHEGDVCFICHKLLGRTALGAYNGELVHYACYTRNRDNGV